LISTAVSVERVGGTSFTLGFAVTVEGRAAAKGKITIVCTDQATQRPRLVPERMAESLRG
jgi:acyl-CoA thioesterase FadM